MPWIAEDACYRLFPYFFPVVIEEFLVEGSLLVSKIRFALLDYQG